MVAVETAVEVMAAMVAVETAVEVMVAMVAVETAVEVMVAADGGGGGSQWRRHGWRWW